MSTIHGRLAASHREFLTGLGIADDLIEARGYTTICSKSGNGPDGMKHWGFSKFHWANAGLNYSARTGAIAAPLWDATNTRTGVHLRLDEPILRPTGLRRWVLPFFAAKGGFYAPIDIHPSQNLFASPGQPVVICTGVLPGDQVLTVANNESVAVTPVSLIIPKTGLDGDGLSEELLKIVEGRQVFVAPHLAAETYTDEDLKTINVITGLLKKTLAPNMVTTVTGQTAGDVVTAVKAALDPMPTQRGLEPRNDDTVDQDYADDDTGDYDYADYTDDDTGDYDYAYDDDDF